MECVRIKKVITLSIDYIKRVSLNYVDDNGVKANPTKLCFSVFSDFRC